MVLHLAAIITSCVGITSCGVTPDSRLVRGALVALAKGGTVYPKGRLFTDSQAMETDQLVALAQRRGAWNALAKQLH